METQPNVGVPNPARKLKFTLISEPHKFAIERYERSVISQKNDQECGDSQYTEASMGEIEFVSVTDLKEYLLLFEFEEEEEKMSILDQSPWSIQRHCLNITKWQPTLSLNDVDFNRIQLWIKVHGPELGVFNYANACQIGEGIEKCIEIEEPNDQIKRGFKWTNLRGEECWADVKYERLSEMCYDCGRLGHASYQCKLDTIMSEVKPGIPMYRTWVIDIHPKATISSVKLGEVCS